MWRIFVVVGFCLLMTSCVSKRKLTYLRKSFDPILVPQEAYRVRPNDNLFIEIKSQDPSASSFYNLNKENVNGLFNGAFIYLHSHSVSLNGDITLPFVGEVSVKDLTVQEASKAIEKALFDHLRDATVFVKLVSNEVTILGEVRNPGTYPIYNDETTIFQALGLAGDLTNYGKRKEIKVLRKDKTGRQVTYEIDLTRYDVFNSKGYFIYPHDVIYVEPMRVKPMEMNLKPMAVFLSGTAVVLLVLRTFDE